MLQKLKAYRIKKANEKMAKNTRQLKSEFDVIQEQRGVAIDNLKILKKILDESIA